MDMRLSMPAPLFPVTCSCVFPADVAQEGDTKDDVLGDVYDQLE